MAGVGQPHIMGIPIERAIVKNSHIAENFPTLERVRRELERTVLDQFGIQATISGEIDILEKNTVLGALYRRPFLREVDVHLVRLG